jgi:hypothetical protein
MKKILIVFCAIIFASCTGVETSIFTTDKVSNTDYFDIRPFVVDNIKSVDEKNCVYVTNKCNYITDEFLAGKASFVAKKGLFQIGDTVTVCKFTKIK